MEYIGRVGRKQEKKTDRKTEKDRASSLVVIVLKERGSNLQARESFLLGVRCNGVCPITGKQGESSGKSRRDQNGNKLIYSVS